MKHRSYVPQVRSENSPKGKASMTNIHNIIHVMGHKLSTDECMVYIFHSIIFCAKCKDSLESPIVPSQLIGLSKEL